MTKECDHKSAGILVRNDGALLMIERKKYNPGFAIPAGHLDGDTPEAAAEKELMEEVALRAEILKKKLVIDLPNTCKRSGGDHHEWTIFEAVNWSGKVRPSETEAKKYIWAAGDDIRELTEMLKSFALNHEIKLDNIKSLPDLVAHTNSDQAWKESPGLEPPMYFLFRGLGII